MVTLALAIVEPFTPMLVQYIQAHAVLRRAKQHACTVIAVIVPAQVHRTLLGKSTVLNYSFIRPYIFLELVHRRRQTRTHAPASVQRRFYQVLAMSVHHHQVHARRVHVSRLAVAVIHTAVVFIPIMPIAVLSLFEQHQHSFW